MAHRLRFDALLFHVQMQPAAATTALGAYAPRVAKRSPLMQAT